MMTNWVISVSHIYWGGQLKSDGSVGTCEMYGGEWEYIRGFGGKT